MSQIQGKTALITGGASGIGKLTGELLLAEGLKTLLIWDVDANAMEKTLAEFRGKGYKAEGMQVDVSNRDAIPEHARQTLQVYGAPDILVNNAGIVTGKYFHRHNYDEIARTMEINALAPQYITHAFLDAMIKRGSGHIINIASAAGMVANPVMAVYCASKWAAIGWSESLRIEMEQLKTGIRLTTVTPYYIDTGMFKGVKTVKIMPVLKPKKVAHKIVLGIKRNKIFVRTPKLLYLLPLLKGILPVPWFDWLVGKQFKVYHSMKTFKGHQ